MSELTDLTMLYWVGSGAESTLQFVGDAETKLINCSSLFLVGEA